MLRQRPIVYGALAAVLGGLLLMGVPVDRAFFIELFMFMLVMHLSGHGHGGHRHGYHEEHGTQDDPAGRRYVATTPIRDEATGE